MTPLISAITLTVLGAGVIGLFAYLMHRAANRRTAPAAEQAEGGPAAGTGPMLACVIADGGGDAGGGD